MKKSQNRVRYLRKRINSLLDNDEIELLTIKCRKYKMPSAYVIEY